MKAQTQKGHLYKKNSSWHVRWRELERRPDGTINQVNRSQKLASVFDYPQKREVQPLFMEFIGKLNTAGFSVDASMTVSRFFEERYSRWAVDNLAASTRKNYRQVWYQRLATRLGSLRVRDVRPMHIEDVLASIVRDNPKLSKRTLQRAKATLSGIFTRAVALGLIDRNPVREIGLPRTKSREKETHAYTPEEVEYMLAALPNPAKAVCAVAAYAGLTASEIRGLQWSDYEANAGMLYVRRGVWRNTIGETKTVARNKPVPVIPRLTRVLEDYRASLSVEGKWIFSSSVGTSLDLDNLVKRVIQPALHHCVRCGVVLGKHGDSEHEFQLDESRPVWHGYHAFRRSLATTLYSLNIPELVIQRILRHKPGSAVTRTHYIKPIDSEMRNAMETLEKSVVRSPIVPQVSNLPTLIH
jgi:integrase